MRAADSAHLPDRQRMPRALRLDLQRTGHRDDRADFAPRAVGDEDLSAGRVRLDPSRQIDGAAHGRIFHPAVRADVADDRLAGVDADAHLDLGHSLLAVSRVHVVHGSLHGHRAGDGALGVVRHRRRGAEDDQDAVAHDLVDRSAIVKDQVDHRLQIVVEEPDRLFRRDALGQGGEASQV